MKLTNLAYQIRLFTTVLIVGILLSSSIIAREKDIDEWQIRENLVSRLSAEWYKIGILNRELANITDVLSDIRGLQLFPTGITKLSENMLVEFDKKIEKLEKEHKQIQNRVDELRAPLADAMAILREMVIGQPVAEMFTALEQGDLERINTMLDIKHQTDDLWKKVDGLLDFCMTQMDMPLIKKERTQGIEGDFFEIIRANLGLQSKEYYKKLNVIKDTLFNRGTKPQIDEMFLVEMHLIKEYLNKNKASIAIDKLPILKKRYEGKLNIDELNLLYARSHFVVGKYHEAIEGAEALPANKMYGNAKILYVLQSRFALEDYDAVIRWASSFDFKKLLGKNRNLALWIVMESILILESSDDIARYASIAVQDASYMLHLMHTLARSFIKNEEYTSALSVLERAIRFEPLNKTDEKAYNRILLSIAQTNYEIGNFDKALNLYFELLENEENYEECLFGMIWCYINLGQYQKAETSLRKLINQSPDDPRAVEAILILAKRYVNKAQFEWKKTHYLSSQERKLEQLLEDLNNRIAYADTSGIRDERLNKAAGEMKKMLKKLRNEKREDYSGIASQYEKSLNICSMVNQYYNTGTFQELSFSARREKLLHQLDSLMIAVKDDNLNYVAQKSAFSFAKRDIVKIKTLVANSVIFSSELQIDRYRWEKEAIGWMKENVKYAESKLMRNPPSPKDSSAYSQFNAQKKHYAMLIDSLVQQEELLSKTRYFEIKSICNAALSLELTEEDESYIRYHLGEQYYDHENEQFVKAYQKYEQEQTVYDSLLSLYREGILVDKPIEPSPPDPKYHTASLNQFQKLIMEHPYDTLVPAARYSLAWCYNDMGMYDSALKQMQIVSNEHASNPYAPQAWMYVGEHAFDNGYLQKATNAYKQVMTYPESQWFDEALYKYAWSQYRQSNPEKAISSFLALVDLGKSSATGKSMLEKESMDYIAISFSEADITGEKGLAKAAKFIQRFGDAAKGTNILHRLAGVYKDQGRLDMAEKAYRTVLNMFPNHKTSPVIEKELISVLDKKLGSRQANKLKVAYFKKYNKKGKWAKSQSDTLALAAGDSLAGTVLYDAAISQHQLALQNNDSTSYRDAMKSYDSYIRNYPKSSQANECHYNLAEIMFSLGDYPNAAEEYMAVSRRYPDSKYKETAAWNAIVASQNMLRLEEEKAQ